MRKQNIDDMQDWNCFGSRGQRQPRVDAQIAGWSHRKPQICSPCFSCLLAFQVLLVRMAVASHARLRLKISSICIYSETE